MWVMIRAACAALLCVVLPAQALALSCASPSEYKFIGSSVVFVGRLVARTNADDRSCDEIFAVERVLKGVTKELITVRYFPWGNPDERVDCPAPSSPNARLVHTSFDGSGRLVTGSCSYDDVERQADPFMWRTFDRAARRYRERLEEIEKAALPSVQLNAARAAWLDVMGDVERAADAYTDLSRERGDVMYMLRSSKDFFRRQSRMFERRDEQRTAELNASEEAMARSPGDVAPSIIKAIFLDGFDEHAQAAEAYRAVARLVPDRWFWLAMLARAELQSGQTDKARVTLGRALLLAPNEPVVQGLSDLVGVRPTAPATPVDRWLRYGRFTTATFAGAKADGLDLSLGWIQDGNFVLSSLAQARFDGAWIQRASFTGANLSSADFSHSIFGAHPGIQDEHNVHASFDWASLRDARFHSTEITAGSFFSTDLTGVDARKSRLHKAKFLRAQLTNADFREALIVGSRVDGSKLDGLRLIDARLYETAIRGSSLRGARFDGAYLGGVSIDITDSEGISFDHAIYDCETEIFRFKNYRIEKVAPQSLGMLSAKTRCDAREIRRDYSSRRLGGRNLGSAALEGAILRDTVFTEAEIACLKLAGADVRGADFSQTRSGSCEIEHEKLRGAVYDDRTKWPPHWGAFDPVAYGMIRQ